MASTFVRCAGLCLLLSTVATGAVTHDPARRADEPAPVAPARRPVSRLDRLPLRFVENRGQADERFGYFVRGRSRTIGFAPDRVRFVVGEGAARSAVDAEFEGARADAAPVGRDRAATVFNWFRGPREDWRTGVPAFGTLAYRDLWPGIDLEWKGGEGRLKYQFVVRPGADPAAIGLLWRGASSVSVDAAGRLSVATAAGAFDDDAPVAWQEKDGARVPVDVSFSLGAPGTDGARSQGFSLGEFDATLPLVIDPAVVVYAGFLAGSSGEEAGEGIAVDSSGAAYVVGRTRSDVDFFPVKNGPDTTFNGGELDAFVAKVNAAGTDLVYAGFIGGSDDDDASAVAVDSLGNAYVAGLTYSNEVSFPLAGGLDATHNGIYDAFVCKVNPQGTGLVWSGFIGGAGRDVARAVGLDASRNVYVAGFTDSAGTGFPAVVGPSIVGAGGREAFVAKVLADGSALAYAGYIGGAGGDDAYALAVDPSDGSVFVAGGTGSDQATFPVSVGPDLTHNGGEDAFIAHVKPDGTSLLSCGYVGGSAGDRAYGVAVAADHSAWVGGFTSSTETTFPVAVGPDLVYNGGTDAFVAHVKADATSLLACGYVGGSNYDAAYGLALDGTGGVWITGQTSSTETTFPVSVGPSLTYGGGSTDPFVTRIDAATAAVTASGFVGGAASDYANAVAASASGDAYIVGTTNSDETTFPVAVGPDVTRNGTGTNSFVAKIGAGVPTIESFFLPKKVKAKANAAAPSKSKLSAGGIFDTGPDAPDFASAATLDVGGLHFDIPGLVQKGKVFAFTGSGVTFSIAPNPYGSSRAKFKLKYAGDLTGKVSMNGALDLHFTDAITDGGGTVELGGGVFGLGKVRGALVQPNLFVVRAHAILKGSGKDSFAVIIGLATGGVTPPEASDLTVGFADVVSATIPKASFVRKGDTDTFTGDQDGVTKVVVDYAREQIAVTGKNLDLGTFAQGGNSVLLTVGLGTDVRAVRVRMGRIGNIMKY